ncbi:uncharacterized protein LOC107265305 isoform X2 [Cephus cinctus]|nr:uncharacterized protein LOC107265305 isoform X2 [Cephus cinctus]
MATPNSMLMDDRWKSKKVFLLSMNALKHQNRNFTNKISKVYTRRIIKNFKGNTVLYMLKRNNEQSEDGINWNNLSMNNQTIATISPSSDTIDNYNSQHLSKISETISIDHLNIDDNKFNTEKSLQVQKALSQQVTRNLPNILRPKCTKLKYKAENSENSQDYRYDVPGNLQHNCDPVKHISKEAHQTTATDVKKVYIKNSGNKRKQVYKPLSIKQESPKWVSENEISEETLLEGTSNKKNFNEINVKTFASSDKNKLRIDDVEESQTVMTDQSLNCMLQSKMYMEQEFHLNTNMIDQGNIESQDFKCTSNQNEINGIQSELCIPNYTDFLGIGNYLTDSDEVHKLLHPTLDDYNYKTDSRNSDTNDLDLLIRHNCAEQHVKTVRKLLPESIIIRNDICGREKANNVVKDTESSIENTVLFKNIELPGRNIAQNELKFECNKNIQNIGNWNVHEILDSQVTAYKIQDDNVLDLPYSLVNNSMTIQETSDNLITESELLLNHKNSHKKKRNKLTTKKMSKEKSNKNKCDNTAADCLTECTEQFGDGCFHEFKTSIVHYDAEKNIYKNHLYFSKNLITTYDSASCEKKYKRRSDKIDHIKILHEAAILPKEPPASLRCTSCSKIYSKLGSLKKHMELHENFRLTCKRCSKTFREKVDFTRHVDRKCHNANTL